MVDVSFILTLQLQQIAFLTIKIKLSLKNINSNNSQFFSPQNLLVMYYLNMVVNSQEKVRVPP